MTTLVCNRLSDWMNINTQWMEAVAIGHTFMLLLGLNLESETNSQNGTGRDWTSWILHTIVVVNSDVIWKGDQ